MAGYRWNPHNNREIFHMKPPVSIMLESLWINSVETPGVGMPGKPYFAPEFLHQPEMGCEFFSL